MTWREPNPSREGTEATCDSLRELAAAYSPILRYDVTERSFPVLAESWLSHTTAAPWVDTDHEADDLPVDESRRGTAIMEANPDLAGLQHRGGPPNAFDRPIQLSTSFLDPDSIGKYAGVDARTFLDFAGWRPDSDLHRGDEDYLYAAFSELSAAMAVDQPWTLLEDQPNVPHLWVPQPVNPTVYAEIEWGGMYPQWSTSTGTGDFPTDGAPELDQLLVLTYYYLYSMREPPADGGVRRLEGQWEAISILFPCDPGELRNADGRPTTLRWFEPPSFVVISKNIDRSGETPLRQHLNEVRAYGSVERAHAHPVIYVGAGTHRHFFDSGSIVFNPNSNPPPGAGSTDTEGGGDFPGAEMLLVWSVVAAVAAGVLLAAGLVVLAAIFFWLAILLFLLWLISLIADAINQASGDPLPPGQTNEEAGGGGAQGGSQDEPPAGGSSGPDPTASAPAGTPNAGSPTGRDIVSFDVRVVDLLHHGNDRTDFPAKDCEHPHWWDYSGSWGVNVSAPSLNNDWESGTQRVDEVHRSWGYWHALRFATSLNGGSPGP